MPSTPFLRILLLLLSSSSISCFLNKWESCSSVNRCGNFRFSYPFGRRHSGCGDRDFQLGCDLMGRHPLLNISGNEYQILEPYILGNNSINHSIMIAIDNFQLDKCKLLDNYTQSWWYGSNYFQMAHGYTNLTFWRDCHESKYSEKNYTVKILELSLCGNVWYYSFSPETDLSGGTFFCKTHLRLPIQKEALQSNQSINNETFLRQGFEMIWQVDPYRDENCGACLMSNGSCGYNKSTAFLCYCPDGTSQPDKCPGPSFILWSMGVPSQSSWKVKHVYFICNPIHCFLFI
jgi:hypothetical protein